MKPVAILGVIGAIGSFLWGVFVWQAEQRTLREQMKIEGRRVADTRRMEAMRPFLERQLQLYTEATQAAALLVTLPMDSDELVAASNRFWGLYWGELALVEDPGVESAMKRLGDGLKDSLPRIQIEPLVLGLAHACRDSMAISWATSAWASRE